MGLSLCNERTALVSQPDVDVIYWWEMSLLVFKSGPAANPRHAASGMAGPELGVYYHWQTRGSVL